MFEMRLRGYRGIGYARGEAPLGVAETSDESIVENDQRFIQDLSDSGGA